MSKIKIKPKLESSSEKRCSVCDKTFIATGGLAYHEATYHKILIGRWARKNFTAWRSRCAKCGLHFRYRDLIPFHNCDDVLNPKENGENSTIHDKVLENGNDISATETTSGGQKFQCSICGKNFDDKPNLNVHIRDLHNGEKINDCDKCNKRFQTKRKLEDHYARRHIGMPRYQCESCGKKYFHFGAYRYHIKVSHLEEYHGGLRALPINELYSMDGCVVIDGPNTLRCQICKKTCTSKKMFDRHMKIAHRKKQWMLACNKCDKIYEKKVSLDDHYACDHLDVIRYACEFCGESFTWRHAYFEHLKKQHSNKYRDLVRRNKTHVISYNKLNIGNDLDEILTNDTLRERSCVMCIRIFNSKTELFEHIQSQHLSKTFDCNRCDKMFYVESQLELHFAETHADKPWFRCEICVKNFDSKERYCSHHQTDHPEEYARLMQQKSCDQLYEIDGYLIVERVSLEDQLLKTRDSYEEQNCVAIKLEPPAEEPMDNDDEVRCSSIKSEIELTQVTVENEQELMYTCNLCGKTFGSETDVLSVRQHSLILHKINLHGIFDDSFCIKMKNIDDESKKEFKYHCEICDYRFRVKRVFVNHECGMAKEQNTNVKNAKHQCNLCKKIFKYKTNLSNHLRDEHTQTPFNCYICEKTFFSRRLLEEHKFAVHYKKPMYRCTLCKLTFSNISKCFEHRRKFHAEELERAEELAEIDGYLFVERVSLEDQLFKTRDSCELEPPAEEPMDNDDEVRCSSIKSEIEMLYSCNLCAKKFGRETDLLSIRQHSLILHKINLHGIFDDSFCIKVKNIDDVLKKEFKYHCDICDYRFRVKRIYVHHECGMAKEQNTNVKNADHQCNVCKKIFKYKTNLTNHLRDEHSQTRNKCDACEKAFLSQRQLEEHKFAVHYKKPMYRCTLCELTFSAMSKCFDHRKKFHAEDLERAEKPVPKYADWVHSSQNTVFRIKSEECQTRTNRKANKNKTTSWPDRRKIVRQSSFWLQLNAGTGRVEGDKILPRRVMDKPNEADSKTSLPIPTAPLDEAVVWDLESFFCEPNSRRMAKPEQIQPEGGVGNAPGHCQAPA
ncbi:zinc finger protein 808-like [Uranotaenia lowii]|uniref:zinc finger protein 808-like n=1 Tax=Uranotaenia lowii TaxID=190385 RepID=UPI00247AB670|nr:zinc finger protein 808-like [Uranotaenia lowii]